MKKNTVYRWLIIVLPIAAALWLLYPTYTYNQLSEERQRLLKDSVALSNWDRANGEAYKAAGDRRLKLGLDLRGGLYATLEVDIPSMIEQAVDPGSMDNDIQKIIDDTRNEVKNSDADVVDVFLGKMRASGKKLVSYFAITDGSDVTEEGIAKKLKDDANGAIEQALTVISERINQYSLSEVNIQKVGNRRIQLEMPDVKDESEVRKLISETARLEFRRVVESTDALAAILRIDKYLVGGKEATAPKPADSTGVAQADSLKVDSTKKSASKNDTAKAIAAADSTSVDTSAKDTTGKEQKTIEQIRAEHPLGAYVFVRGLSGNSAPPVGAITEEELSRIPAASQFELVTTGSDMMRIQQLLARREIRALLPPGIDLLFDAKAEGGAAAQKQPLSQQAFVLYVVAREADLTGDVVKNARPDFDQNNRRAVSMSMNDYGAERWATITKQNVGKRIAVVLDGRVQTAPTVQNEITGGNSIITGQSTTEESNRLAIVLRAGSLKAPVSIIEERLVGPSLGEDSIQRGVTSSLISFAIVILFMLVYYAIGGAIADIALLMNILLVVAAMTQWGATLTLPGIAGLILSTAMAVDANILIFERIREELYAGRTLKVAVQQGFSKAWSAIFDSNVTHLISSIVLVLLGTGPVKGFAVTLIIGVFMTVFTAVAVTRAMFEIAIASGATTINLGQKKSTAA